MQAQAHPSPNFDTRAGDIDLIVLHYTAMADAPSALARLCAPEHKVSCHYLIARDGVLYRLVEEEKRAWHAGAGSWGGRGDVNGRSLGIELDNDGASPFAAAQMATLETLLRRLMTRWKIAPEAVIAHSDMAPSRKADPGRRFDWRRLALQGLSVWPELAEDGAPAPDEAGFLALAARFGYPQDVGLNPVLEAFRQRFRPWAEGPLDAADMAAIADLAARFPIDRDAATT